jgi:LmbE family N-acetylglucosaminyl deacetylase
MRTLRVLVPTIALLLLGTSVPAQLRVRPVGELPNDVALRLQLRKLASTGTFMETTAHPDDEDNAVLAMMSHGRGMRTTLVSATRGDGGQNEIGPELFQALGVLRTEELLAVHRFDGAEQYFTRAVDFGFSFSIEESIEKWGHDEIVGDYVRHIRTIRPDVVVGFLCGGGGGGQHHQASTRLTLEAFRAAADPSRYPDQIREGLRPWQAKRVFCTEGFGAQGQATPDLLRVTATSEFDPLLGRTYSELGLEGRSMHKCQGTSQLLMLPGATSVRCGNGARGEGSGAISRRHRQQQHEWPGERHDIDSSSGRVDRRACVGGGEVRAPGRAGDDDVYGHSSSGGACRRHRYPCCRFSPGCHVAGRLPGGRISTHPPSPRRRTSGHSGESD